MVVTLCTEAALSVEITDAMDYGSIKAIGSVRFDSFYANDGTLYLTKKKAENGLKFVIATLCHGPVFYFVIPDAAIEDDAIATALFKNSDFLDEFEKAVEWQNLRKPRPRVFDPLKPRKPRTLKQLRYLESRGIRAKR